jgi:hypothetical protein
MRTQLSNLQEVIDTAVSKNSELSASFEIAKQELENKKKEILIYEKKHAKVQQIEMENLALSEKNSALCVEIEKLKKG